MRTSSSSNRHLLLLTPGFPKDEQDSTCIPALQDFVLALKNHYQTWNISVLTLQYPFQKALYYWHDIPVFACGGRNASFPKRLLTWNKAATHLQKLNKQHPIDLIHSFWLTEAAWIANRFSVKQSIPHVCTLMGQDALKSNSYLKKIRLQRLSPVALSDRQAVEFEGNTGLKPSLIPWGIPSWKKTTENHTIDLFGAGNLTTLKDYDTFLEVVALLKSDFPDLKAEIAGEGPEEKALQKKIQLLGVQDNIRILGKIDRAEVMQKMEQSKVFLHPSTYESFGLVFSEAMASGTCIVSRNVGQAKPSDHWKTGQKTAELANHCKQFLQSSLTIAAPKTYTTEDCVDQYISLYKQLLITSA